ncbi:hypothetical protein [Komagataeibacter sp. FXV3]|uniref:hypothetical protein n=1 Tax=Komagataeibacter sp. FXV3 TaxID=2608998 RepID=UPI00187B51F7|nr:hypothetical protein [Komagataeibacter sp. FXV3]MBE7728906.1 hypothetical protein [Komagataeibacter sp. FXV3]
MTVFINTSGACALLLSGMNTCLAAGTTRAREAHACEKDAFRFCGTDIPNKKKIAACLQAHREQLRPACRALFPVAGTQPGNNTRDTHIVD